MKPLFAEDLNYILERTQSVWEELRQCHLFITGGTGFFGMWLLESFLWANDRLNLQAKATVLTRSIDSFKQKAPHLVNHKALIFHEGDVRSFTFPVGRFTHIIHAATEASAKLNVEEPIKMLNVILEGTKRTLDFACQAGAKKILLTSSGAVYGRQPSELTHIPETYEGSPDINMPQSAYGIGKRTSEHMAILYAYQHKLNIKIARCFSFVGPYLPLDTHFAIGNFIGNALHHKTIEIGGDGTPYRSYQYAADLTVWLWKILCQGQVCHPYNVGSDEDYTIADLAQMVASSVVPHLAVNIAKEPNPTKPPERYVPSVVRVKKELNLDNGVSLQEAIYKTMKWYHAE